VNEAVRANDEKAVEKELADLVRRFDGATRALREAAALIK